VTASPASGGALAAASTTNEICDAVGGELLAAGARHREQLVELDAGLFATLRDGRDREAELGEAIKRRDAAIDLAQDANGVLARKKKAYSSVKPTDKEYGRKSAEASQAVERVSGRARTDRPLRHCPSSPHSPPRRLRTACPRARTSWRR
jgi:hypothetical protein